MCGIGGIINFDNRPVKSMDLKKISNALIHRGPDGDGIFISNNVGFAHRRLTIIDLHGGQQPFVDHESNIALTYNGEVYNYVEIRKELDGQLTTTSDTEVVLRAYQKWGMACLQKFRGMFAFAIFDPKINKVFLVRDRIGIKPVYYYSSEREFVFASELQALTQYIASSGEIDDLALSGYLKFQYVPTPMTIYKNVFKLEPGHYLEIDVTSGKTINKKYWQLESNVHRATRTDWLEETNEILDETVAMYCRSDVPFGAFLSGGVDSSLITGIMSKHLSYPVKTFSIGFGEKRYSELPYAKHVSDVLKTDHYEKVIDPHLTLDVLHLLSRHFGEPFADSSAVPTYYVSKETSKQVKMVLSGDGGDELFAGYDAYKIIFELSRKKPNDTLRKLFKKLITFQVHPRLRKLVQPIYTRMYYYSLSRGQKLDVFREIFADHELTGLIPDQKHHYPSISAQFENDDSELVDRFQKIDLTTYLLDDILTKVDRMSMANSLEVRVPLLDHKVVELAFSMPIDLKIFYNKAKKRVESKDILKRSAQRFFDRAFLDRPKMGFGIPVNEWCRLPLREFIEDSLRSVNNPIFSHIDYNWTQKFLDRFYFHNSGSGAQLWALMMFDMWLKDQKASTLKTKSGTKHESAPAII